MVMNGFFLVGGSRGLTKGGAVAMEKQHMGLGPVLGYRSSILAEVVERNGQYLQ